MKFRRLHNHSLSLNIWWTSWKCWQKYYDEGVRIIETLKHAYELYIRQSSTEKRKMLNYLLSNCTLENKKVSYDCNLPFSYFVNFASCRPKYARRDCLGRSRLTAIPHFVFRNLRFFQTKLLHPQLAPARTRKCLRTLRFSTLPNKN